MEFEDKNLNCEDCSEEFVFSSDEQAFYNERGFENEPKRCKPCRQKKKASRQGHGGGRGGFSSRPRESHDVVCAECGENTTVPFKPTGDRPVYCNDCFRSKRS